MGNKDDVVTFIDAKTHRSKAEEQFKFEVNEISWNNDNNMFFLTNGNGCINILRWVAVVAAGWGTKAGCPGALLLAEAVWGTRVPRPSDSQSL